MPVPVRLIAVDLDGTLLDPSDRVTDRVRDAVARASAVGVPVVPVTGRPDRLVWDVAADAGLGPLGVCSNGAVIVDLRSNEVLVRRGFSGRQAIELVDLIREHVPGAALAADRGDRFIFEDAVLDGLGLEPRSGRLRVDDIRTAVADGCLKLVARRADLSSLALSAELSPALRAAAAVPTGAGEAETAGMDVAAPGDLAEVTASDIAWADIGPAGLTKATGLADICGRLGLAAAEVAAIGDHFNDLPMLRWAGLVGAMGNAIPEVLDAADVVMPSNADDGVAAFIDLVLSGR